MLLLTMLLELQRQTDIPSPSNQAGDTRGSDKGGAESGTSTDASLGLADASLSAAGASLNTAGTKASLYYSAWQCTTHTQFRAPDPYKVTLNTSYYTIPSLSQ